MEEIKAGDIMLNNWVEYDGKYYQISALSEEYPFLNTDAFGVGVVTYRNIKGIPLTEDILVNAGFEELYKSKYIRKFKSVYIITIIHFGILNTSTNSRTYSNHSQETI